MTVDIACPTCSVEPGSPCFSRKGDEMSSYHVARASAARAAPSAKCDFLVYGNFTDPTTKANGIVVRMSEGRIPWSKQIVPAIQKMIASWKDDDGEKLRWNVDGDPEPGALWSSKSFRRYEWRDGALVEVEAP